MYKYRTSRGVMLFAIEPSQAPAVTASASSHFKPLKMSSEKYVLLAIAFAAALTAVEAAPRIVSLRDVENRTVCPFRVEIDEDPERVPRRIKMIRCAEQPNHYCRARNIPDNECCHHKHFDHTMECVEVMDTALVYYNSTKRTEAYDVTVGCTCMIAASRADFPGS